MADKKVQKTAAVLPLSVEEGKEKKKQARGCLLSELPGVRDVILWTLLNAGIFPLSAAMGIAYYMLITTIFSHPASWLLPRHLEMTDAEETMADALINGMLWCAAPQAAAAAVALMLSRRHRRLRLILAYAALVATFAGHYMLSGAIRLFGAADPAGGLGLSTSGPSAPRQSSSLGSATSSASWDSSSVEGRSSRAGTTTLL